MGEVVGQAGLGHAAQWNEAFFTALAPDPEVAVGQQVSNAQAGQLGQPQPGVEKEVAVCPVLLLPIASERREMAGVPSRLEQLTRVTEAELGQLHGMGPKALRQLREALLRPDADSKPLRRHLDPSDQLGSGKVMNPGSGPRVEAWT